MTPLKNQAIQTALMGNWEAAIALNLALLEEDSNDIEALNRLALAYTVRGQIKRAKKAYQKVFQIDPLNPIALKNLKRLNEKSETDNVNSQNSFQINNNFIEETGKTKVVELVNIAQPKVIEMLKTGQSVNIVIKRSRLFVLEGEKQYIGVLPDDIGKRLIKFINNGNKYETYIKCATPNRLLVFIKEIKRAAKFKHHPSFTSISDTALTFDKDNKLKSRIKNKKHEEDESAQDLSEDEE